MTVAPQQSGHVAAGGSGNLYDVLELILDRGLVIDAFVRVSLVGIELLKIDARVVVASVDTYLRFAEACNRLDLEAGRKAPETLTDIVGEVTEGGARGKTRGAVTGAVEAITDSFQDSFRADRAEDEEDRAGDEEPEPEPRPRSARKRPVRNREEE
ncbi:gas vesicle structural protein GvpA [Streptomyces sp. NPDC059396]|uniref:gas vesicle structural protein GvpA n=1 Tax=unclassified Streptomyces TaxID=2593676 RepID=UPI00368F9727